MNDCMKDICYKRYNFNVDHDQDRIPVHITDKWTLYPLTTEDSGELSCQKDDGGQPVKYPRCLRDICIYCLVCTSESVKSLSAEYFPSNCYPLMLTEAIFLQEGAAIEWLVSTWPMKTLRVYDAIPLEDSIEDDYLSRPCEGTNYKGMSLLDHFVMGLLQLKSESNLKTIDFTGFGKDRKLVKELCRLPILWMKPSSRTVEGLHDYMAETLEISKDKAQRFMNRISTVYCNMDGEFKHENKIEVLNIALDLHIVIDDVPIGLSLQSLSPFHFQCHKLWMKPVPEVLLNMENVHKVINVKNITHFEYDDPLLPQDNALFSSLIHMLATFTCLTVLSLPNSVDVKNNQQMPSSLNKLLRKLPYVQKVNLSYCNLVGRLSTLLGGLRTRFTYISLRDCRLNEDDIMFLSKWKCLPYIRELNLSCNNLAAHHDMLMQIILALKRITCFSISFCQLNTHWLALIAKQLKKAANLKVLSMQGYTPLPQNGTLELLSICAQIRSLQKLVLFPETYGFPGHNEDERQLNRFHTFRFSYRYLEMRGRSDIDLQE